MQRYRAARLRPSFQIQMMVAAWMLSSGASLLGPGVTYTAAPVWALVQHVMPESALGIGMSMLGLLNALFAWRGSPKANGPLLCFSGAILAGIGVAAVIAVWREAGILSAFAIYAIALSWGCVIAARLVSEER